MDEQLIFTTHNTGSVANVHSFEQSNLRQCTISSKNSAVTVGNQYLFVAQAKKALINVYNIAGAHKRESIEQRLPIPEAVNCLEVVNNSNGVNVNGSSHTLGHFNLPYLLLASTASGKLYIWELNSGLLLNVKPMAHYQTITKIQSILNGKYIVTSGKDSRVIIWQTVDLVTMEEPKPVAIIHDHTLPVTDFQVSNATGENLVVSGAKLFTVSDDCTVRCYNLAMNPTNGVGKNGSGSATNDQQLGPTLIATFTLPFGIESLALDPADRALYLGTKEGCYALPLYYKLNGNQVVNLLQPSSDNKGKLYSLIDSVLANESERNSLYTMGQLIVTKVLDCDVSVLNITMDGTTLLIGDKLGKVSVTEIYSRQILKTLQPLSTSQEAHGGVTNIITYCYTADSNDKLSSMLTNSHHGNAAVQKIPTLQRSIYDKRQQNDYHDIWYQIGQEIEDETTGIINPLTNSTGYMSQLSQQETVFATSKDHYSHTSIVKVAETPVETSDNAAVVETDEMAQLKEQVKSLTSAYTELRTLHEKLYEDHQQLLNQ
ncbi:pre-rRNA-processing protein Ipi3p [Monosporozyma servazzii]